MKAKQVILQALLALMPALAMAQTEGVKFIDDKTLYEVIQLAAQQQKLVFVDCYTTWCGPCKMMANNEFPKKEAGDYFNAKFVNAKFDMEKGEGPDIARKYQVTAYPTFLVLNEHGEMVHRVVGADEITSFIQRVEQGLTGKTLAQYQKEYASGERGEAFLREYLGVLTEQHMRNDAARLTRELIGQKSADDVIADSLLFRCYVTQCQPGPSDPLFLSICRNRAKVRQLQGEDGSRVLTILWNNAFMAARREGTLDSLRIQQLKKQMEDCGFGGEADAIIARYQSLAAPAAPADGKATRDAVPMMRVQVRR